MPQRKGERERENNVPSRALPGQAHGQPPQQHDKLSTNIANANEAQKTRNQMERILMEQIEMK
eukprot:scaffold248080_cov19-Prasinocladus_malaysianus.AAC.1